MVKKGQSKISSSEMEKLEKLGAAHASDTTELREELLDNAPPWEEIAPEELKRLEETGELMAARAESYYYGYIRTSAGSGVEPQAAGAIVGAVVGSTVGTVVGQIVGKKLDKTLNVHDLVIRDRIRDVGSSVQRK